MVQVQVQTLCERVRTRCTGVQSADEGWVRGLCGSSYYLVTGVTGGDGGLPIVFWGDFLSDTYPVVS